MLVSVYSTYLYLAYLTNKLYILLFSSRLEKINHTDLHKRHGPHTIST